MSKPFYICACGKPLWAGLAIHGNDYRQWCSMAVEHTDRTPVEEQRCCDYVHALPMIELNALLKKPGADQLAEAEALRAVWPGGDALPEARP